jgi:hypothetical protein
VQGSRDIHVIGTVRAENTRQGMNRLARRFKRRIRTLPTCEIPFPNWVIETLEARENNPYFTVSRKSRMSRNDKAGKQLPRLWWPVWEPGRYRAAPGVTLTPAMLQLPYADEAAKAWKVFSEITSDPSIDVRDDLTLQQSIPDPDNMAWFSSWRPWSAYDLEAKAMLAEIERIYELTGGNVTFHWEGPLQTIAIAEAPRWLQARIADKVMSRACAFIAQAPKGSRWIIHFCCGNKHDTPVVSLSDAGPLVHGANAASEHFPKDQILDGFTFPFGDRLNPVPTSRKFYLPTQDLELPTGVRPMAGLVRAGVGPWDESLARHRTAFDTVEEVADCGLWVVTSPCGWSRQSEEATTETMDLHESIATGRDCRATRRPSPSPR